MPERPDAEFGRPKYFSFDISKSKFNNEVKIIISYFFNITIIKIVIITSVT